MNRRILSRLSLGLVLATVMALATWMLRGRGSATDAILTGVLWAVMVTGYGFWTDRRRDRTKSIAESIRD